MELTNVGMCGKTSDPVSVPLASSSSQGSNMVDTTHGSTEHGCLEYEDVKRSSPCFNMPYKNNNTVYPKIKDKADHHQAHRKGTENINSMECWKESNKDLLALKVTLGIILVVSFTSLVLVVLDVVGVIGSQCVCNGDLGKLRFFVRQIFDFCRLFYRICLSGFNLTSCIGLFLLHSNYSNVNVIIFS